MPTLHQLSTESMANSLPSRMPSAHQKLPMISISAHTKRSTWLSAPQRWKKTVLLVLNALNQAKREQCTPHCKNCFARIPLGAVAEEID